MSELHLELTATRPRIGWVLYDDPDELFSFEDKFDLTKTFCLARGNPELPLAQLHDFRIVKKHLTPYIQ